MSSTLLRLGILFLSLTSIIFAESKTESSRHTPPQQERAAPLITPEKHIRVSAESAPTSFVGNVNTIFGNYLLTSTDLIQPGPVPLHFTRYYDSQRENDVWFGAGTTVNYPSWIYNTPYSLGNPIAHLIVEEDYGSVMDYVAMYYGDGALTDFYVSPAVVKGGLTNTGHEEIDGKTNQKNCVYKLKYTSKSGKVFGYWQAVLSDGTERRYKPSQYSGALLCLEKEVKPNKNKLLISSKGGKDNIFSDFFKRIIACSSDEKRQFGKLEFDHDKKQKKISVKASNGKIAIYRYKEDDLSLELPFEFPYIRSVESPDQPFTKYTYDSGKDKEFSVNILTQIDRPDGRYLKLEYDKSNRVKKQKAPHGPNGEEAVVYRYEYESKEYRTSTFDGLGNKTVYTYSGEKRLKGLRTYTRRDKLYRHIALIWGEGKKIECGERDKSDEGNLLAKVIRDGKSDVLSTHCLFYDNDHNIEKEALYGNLSGNGKSTFEIDSEGRAKKDTVEKYTKRYRHSRDQYHLKTSESEDNGPTIKYGYKKDTNLLTSKLTYDGDNIISREFYEYDNDAVLIQTIIDNGTSSDPKNLKNITERHITKIKPVRGVLGYGIGQPQETREFYYDPQTKKEVLLGKRVFKYTQEGLVKEEAVFDSNDVLRYTLYTTYNKNSLPIEKIDAIGRKTIFSYDDNFNKTREELIGSGFYTTLEYDKANRLTKVSEHHSDGRVLTNSYTYDVMGNMTSATDHFGNTIYYTYDEFNRVTKTTHPAIKLQDGTSAQPIILQDYDVFNNLTSQTDANGHTTETEYTVRGSPYLITYPDGSTERSTYNLDGTLAQVIHRNGSKTEYNYDTLKRVIKERRLDAQGNRLTVEKNTYNAFQKTSSTDPMGFTTQFFYDGAGRLIETKKEVEGAIEKTTFHYDTLNRLHTTKRWIDDSAYIASIQEMDYLNRVIEEREESSDGTLLSLKKYEYDIQGNIIKEISYSSLNEPHTTETEYNTENLPTLIRDALGNETHIAYNLDYTNDLGQRVLEKTTTDPLGNKTIELSDAYHRVVSMERKSSQNTLLSRTEFTYDLKGNKVVQKEHVIIDGYPSRSYSIEWKYTPMDEVESQTEEPRTSDEKSTRYTYTPSGLIHTITKPDGVILTHTYDPLERLLTLSSSDGTVKYTYSYDLNDNITQVQDEIHNTTYTYSYDPWGRKTVDTLLNGVQPKYTYDRLGHLTHADIPNGSIDYIYTQDHLKDVIRRDSQGNELYRHCYTSFDLEGKVLQSELIGQIGTLMTRYDALGRVTSLGSPYWSETIPTNGFDASGNLRSLTINDNIGSFSCSYDYDDLYQLIKESGPFSNSFKNDSLFNRLQKNRASYTLNSLNQLLSDSDTAFTYDKNGNPISLTTYSYQLKLGYDALDRLTSVEIPGVYRFEYMYDSFHRRLQKKEYDWAAYSSSWHERETSNFLYFHKREVGLLNKENALTQLRVLGLGKGAELGASISIELNGSIFCPLHDHRGNISSLINIDSKRTAETYRFSAFGEEEILDASGYTQNHSPLNNPWRFVSKRHDPETGFLFFGRRYYSPSVGRFLTPDPIGFSDGPNLYAYVKNSPMVLLDPYGMTAEENAAQVHGAYNSYQRGRDNFRNDPLGTMSKNYQYMREHGPAIISGDFSKIQACFNSSTSDETRDFFFERLGEFMAAKSAAVALTRNPQAMITNYLIDKAVTAAVKYGASFLYTKKGSGPENQFYDMPNFNLFSPSFNTFAGPGDLGSKRDAPKEQSKKDKKKQNNEIWTESSPFKNKTHEELHEMFKKKNYEFAGGDWRKGHGNYINPKNKRQYHIDPKHIGRYNEPNHVDVSRPEGYTGKLGKKKFGYLDD